MKQSIIFIVNGNFLVNAKTTISLSLSVKRLIIDFSGAASSMSDSVTSSDGSLRKFPTLLLTVHNEFRD